MPVLKGYVTAAFIECIRTFLRAIYRGATIGKETFVNIYDAITQKCLLTSTEC